MKRRIVDILASLQGGITPQGFMYYVTQEGEHYHSHRKDVNGVVTEIEDTWRECRLPLNLTATITRMIGIRKTNVPPFSKQIQEQKEWVFVSILKGILVEEVKPKGQVCIWTEKEGENVSVCGICEVE